MLSPERIVVGGGVPSRPGLLHLVRREVALLLNGYLDTAAVREGIDDFITAPALGSRSGALGAIALGAALLYEPKSSAQ